MKIAFATTFDAQDVNNWSGTPFYMSQALQQAGDDITYIGNLQRKLPANFKLVQAWKKYAAGQRESPRFNVTAAKHYSAQVAPRLGNTDLVLAPQINPIAFLECKQPLVLWTDAVYSSLIGFYPGFSNHSASTIKQGNLITAACLARCHYAIFSSDWAARAAAELYGISREKIKVIPYGANLSSAPTKEKAEQMIAARSNQQLKILFLGKHWIRKGGDIVFKAVKAMHAAGMNIELHFVGCHPPAGESIPDYIKVHGFISKRTPEGRAQLEQLLATCHYLFVPSRAEAYGIVFCEANAYGLPCVTSYVGGIPTVVRDGINGQTFGLDTPPEKYCDYFSGFFSNPAQYQQQARAALNEYHTRLNWQSAIATFKGLF